MYKIIGIKTRTMLKEGVHIIKHDGLAILHEGVANEGQQKFYYDELLSKIHWVNDEIVMFGKSITTKRKVALYADERISYRYSHKTKIGLSWIPVLLSLKELVESYTQNSYNACLLNLYHDGSEGMGWHADNEKEIIQNSSIASLSFGAERTFKFKHKNSNEKISVLLTSGSLLEMKGDIQQHWLHALPKSKKITEPRINLTFRNMYI